MTRKESRNIGIKIRRDYHLSLLQKQICYGGLLGDSNLNWRDNGQCRLKMSHCEKQLDYLEWKKSFLNDFIIQKKPIIDYPNGFGKQNQYSYNTVVHQDFTDMANLFYRMIKGRHIRYITMKTLKLLDLFAVLIWYLDDGTLTKDNELRIYSNAYDISMHKAMKKWFWHKYRLEAKIRSSHNNKYYYICFSVRNSKNLLNLFKQYLPIIPDVMKYKLLTSTTIRETLS